MTLVPLDARASASAELMAALHARVFADAWTAAAFVGLLQIPGTFALVRDAQPEPAGFVLARVVAEEAEIITLGVLPEARRQGVGGELVRAACQRAGAEGARAMLLEVAARNLPAQKLYARFGFTEVGRRKAYYADAGALPDDALVLRRDLVSRRGSAPDDDGVNV